MMSSRALRVLFIGNITGKRIPVCSQRGNNEFLSLKLPSITLSSQNLMGVNWSFGVIHCPLLPSWDVELETDHNQKATFPIWVTIKKGKTWVDKYGKKYVTYRSFCNWKKAKC